MTAAELLRRAADGPLDDATWAKDPRFGHGALMHGVLRPGGGLILALRAAAGAFQNPPGTSQEACQAYDEAYGLLSHYCDPIVPLGRPYAAWQRGREDGEVRAWAALRSVEERRKLLTWCAEES